MEKTAERKLRLDAVALTKFEETPEGFLKCPAVVTRAGIFEYTQPDGSVRRELRRPEQVFREDSMASLHSIPFVDGHPYRDGGEVTAKNSRRLLRGYTGAPAYRHDNDLCVDMIVTDADQIAQVKAGKLQLSAGYNMKLVETPGVWEGQRYDAEQTDIRYNHVASVTKGRAGTARLRLDEDLNLILDKELDMKKIRLDNGTEVEVSDEVAAAFERVGAKLTAETKRADDAEAVFMEADSRAERLAGENDGLKKRLDEASNEKTIREKVKARTLLLGVATRVLPKAEHSRLDEMEDAAIMQAVIRCDAKDPEMKFEGVSTDRLQGRFDQIVASLGTKKTGDGGLGAALLQGRQDEAGGDADDKPKTSQDVAEARKAKLTSRWQDPVRKTSSAK